MADVIRHLMQVAHKWADEPNDPDTGRSDTLEMELRGAMGHVVNAPQVYSLIVRMFKQPDEMLRSMMAQDLCRLLRIGMHARTPAERQEHIAAAGAAIERDQQAGFLPHGVGGTDTSRPVTAQEDRFLREAAKRASKLVAPGKLAPGVTASDGMSSRTELWDAIAELVVSCGGSAADFREDIADRIDAAALSVMAGAPGDTDAERAAWLADKIGALGDYAKEAAAMLRRWPAGVGACQRCGGDGDLPDPSDPSEMRRCPACKGTGRASGVMVDRHQTLRTDPPTGESKAKD